MPLELVDAISSILQEAMLPYTFDNYGFFVETTRTTERGTYTMKLVVTSRESALALLQQQVS